MAEIISLSLLPGLAAVTFGPPVRIIREPGEAMVDVGAVYERYAQDVFRFALYLSGNRALAEDIAAETFARAWVARDQIRVGTVKAYLLMIARHLYTDGRRRDWRAAELDAAMPDPAPDPEAAASGREELAGVLRALQELSEPDRAALLLSAREGLSHEEIAAALGLSVTAVKVKIHRARLKLSERRPRKEQER
jgi:RNA polymerase sigma-70 factor (ECF subfamily)